MFVLLTWIAAGSAVAGAAAAGMFTRRSAKPIPVRVRTRRR